MIRETQAVAEALAGYPPNACILGSRALTAVMDYRGQACRLRTVSVIAGNALALEMIDKNVPTNEWPDSAWTVSVHPDHPPVNSKDWSGHLVVESDGVLMDATSKQFRRAQYNILVPPYLTLRWDGEIAHAEGDDWWILYETRPMPMPTTAPDWHPRKWKPVAASAIRKIHA